MDLLRYLVILGHSWFNETCNSIKYLISKKSGITDNIDYNHAKIRTDPYSSLPKEKILAFHNAIIFIKSVVNKNKNVCCYIFRKKFA